MQNNGAAPKGAYSAGVIVQRDVPFIVPIRGKKGRSRSVRSLVQLDSVLGELAEAFAHTSCLSQSVIDQALDQLAKSIDAHGAMMLEHQPEYRLAAVHQYWTTNPAHAPRMEITKLPWMGAALSRRRVVALKSVMDLPA